MHAAQLTLLLVRKFGLFAAELAVGAGDRHALARAQADEVALKLGVKAQPCENVR